MTTFLYSALTFALLVALFWLLFAPQRKAPSAVRESLDSLSTTPLHCRRFPQICRILEGEDEAFVRSRTRGKIARDWRSERRAILRLYMDALGEDFARLENLARVVASLSPQISRKQEWEWFWLGVQFHVLFRALALRMALGRISFKELSRLTNLVATQAGELERRMALLTDCLPSPLSTDASI